MNRIFIVFLLSLFLLSCGQKKESNTPEKQFAKKSISSSIKYAGLFDIYHADGIRKIVIHSPFSDTAEAAVYYLVDSSKYDKYKSQDNVFPFPLTNIAVLSSTQLDAIIKLGLTDKVSGISDAKYITDSIIKKRLSTKEIIEVSENGQLFVEKTIMLNPQAIFFSPFQKDQNLPVKGSVKAIPFFDFMEDNPLGRAEWIKFTAAFIGNEPKADSIFSSIESEFLSLATVASKAKSKPTVFSGKFFNGQWFVPGGKSYMAQMFAAAGANYIWADDSSRNSVPLDFEVVLQKAQDADYWRMLGGVPEKNPYSSLLQENQLYSHFKAFKKHHIIYCDPASTAYFEKSALEPQVVLKDFIFAFHPELFPNYKPVYYKVLP